MTALVLAALGAVALPAYATAGIVVLGLLGWVVAWILLRTAAPPGTRPAVGNWVRAGLVGGVAVLGYLIIAGLVALVTWAPSVVVLLLLVVPAPLLWLRWRRRAPVVSAACAVQVDPDATAWIDPSVLSTAELRQAWQQTYSALLYSASEAEREAVVGIRQGLLDELERRDPNAFAWWLETGGTHSEIRSSHPAAGAV